jgi:hypothetical protein
VIQEEVSGTHALGTSIRNDLRYLGYVVREAESGLLQAAAAHACGSSNRVEQHQLGLAQLLADALCVVCVYDETQSGSCLTRLVC